MKYRLFWRKNLKSNSNSYFSDKDKLELLLDKIDSIEKKLNQLLYPFQTPNFPKLPENPYQLPPILFNKDKIVYNENMENK